MLDEQLTDPVQFILIDKTPGSDLRIQCLAPDEEEKKSWISMIKSLLDIQNDFLMALQSPIIYQSQLNKELSAPEISNVQQRNSLLRKTQSQPSKSKTSTLPKSSKEKTKSGGSETKHTRTKSIPSSIQNAVHAGKKDSSGSIAGGDGKAVAPGSPTVKDTAEKSSPKPKRGLFEGFKHTLRSKKSHDSSSKSSSHLGGGTGTSSSGGVGGPSQVSSSHLSPGGSASYANVHSAMDSSHSADSGASATTKGSVKQPSTDSGHSDEVS